MANIRRRNDEMQTQRRSSYDPMDIFEEMLGYDPFRAMNVARVSGQEMFVPRFDVKERGDAFIFKADLPGVKDEDVDIQLSGNLLTISGRRQREKTEGSENERYFVRETSYGEFTRSFTLPEGVDGEHVKAELQDGELTLIVPKRPETQPKKITVGRAEQKTGGKKIDPAKA